MFLFLLSGMVGSRFKSVKQPNKVKSNRIKSNDTNLFDFVATKNKIQTLKLDIIINAAARVGGMLTITLHRIYNGKFKN